MDTGELLGNLQRDLEIPGSGVASTAGLPPAPGAATSGDETWHRLRRAIRDLEQGAMLVGELPRHYPMHLNLVMRVIHALLPWYTRPLRQHAEHAVAVAKAMEAILERLEAEARERPVNLARPPQ